MLKLKRAYESPSPDDGYRILVDRLWPRGVTKERAAINFWLKDIAPSNDLRVWFAHDPQRFKEFSVRYVSELEQNDNVKALRYLIEIHKTVTLVYAAKDTRINHAVVLKGFVTNTK